MAVGAIQRVAPYFPPKPSPSDAIVGAYYNYDAGGQSTSLNGVSILPTAYSDKALTNLYGPGVYTTIGSINSKSPELYVPAISEYKTDLPTKEYEGTNIMTTYTESAKRALLYIGLYGSLAVGAFGLGLYKDPSLTWLPVVGPSIANGLAGITGSYTSTLGAGLAVVGAFGVYQTYDTAVSGW